MQGAFCFYRSCVRENEQGTATALEILCHLRKAAFLQGFDAFEEEI